MCASDVTVLRLNTGITANTVYRGKPRSQMWKLALFKTLFNFRYKPDVSKKSHILFVLTLNQSTDISYSPSITNFIPNNMYNIQ